MKTFVKDPDATLDYSVNWSRFLAAADDDFIISATWISDSQELDIVDSGYSDGIHTGFISGGTLGESYTVTSRITTSGGRINDSSFTLLIRET